MDAELKAKWVKALRSGKYKQGKQALFDGDRYCCLGVLCAIQGADFNQIKDDFGSLRLAHSPARFVGVAQPHNEELSNMNDDGKDFRAIARYIEKNL